MVSDNIKREGVIYMLLGLRKDHFDPTVSQTLDVRTEKTPDFLERSRVKRLVKFFEDGRNESDASMLS